MPTYQDELVIDESPCELCANFARCRHRLEACEQFRSFVMYGGRRWRSEPREPSVEIYAKVYRQSAGGSHVSMPALRVANVCCTMNARVSMYGELP